jgi:hypothetical protein
MSMLSNQRVLKITWSFSMAMLNFQGDVSYLAEDREK